MDNGHDLTLTGAELDAALARAQKALPRDGSETMTGNLTIERDGSVTFKGINNVTGREVYLEATSDNFTAIANRVKGDVNNRTMLWLGSETATNDRLLRIHRVKEGTANTFTVHHTGNKPSSSYTGNGSATSRTINTGGSGNALLIRSGKGASALISNSGAIIWSTTGEVSGLGDTAVKFVNGVLTLATADPTLNASGSTYYYQVL